MRRDTEPTPFSWRRAGAAALLLLATGCTTWRTDYPDTLSADVTRDWTVEHVFVFVPEELTVSDRNRFFPSADIVWHGEADGDRRAQVAAIMGDGISRGADALQGTRPVSLDVRLVEFHAVSPVAVSQAPSAVHNVQFAIHVRDVATNDIIAGPDFILAQLEALTGSAAAVAAAEGRGQRARIVDHLAKVTAGWLAAGPDVRETFTTIGR